MGAGSWQVEGRFWERERNVKSVQGKKKKIGKYFIIVIISSGSEEQSQSSNSELFADVRNKLEN